MKILLDCSPAKIAEYRERYNYDFGQLRTPLTQYALAPEPTVWAADNGFFSDQDVASWLRWIAQFDGLRRPLFVALPDIVGDAQRTFELFEAFKDQTRSLPRAIVLQDGIKNVRIPWDDIAAVFIGGSTQFKSSPEAFAAARTAKVLGKHVHLGRCNTAARARNWIELADTIDGTGMDRFDHMLEDVLSTICGTHPQQALLTG